MDEFLFSDPTQISTAEIQLKMHTLLTLFSCWSSALLFSLLYIQLTISFLIGRKRTVNFWNQRLGCHLAADYTIIMSRTLKVTGNHFMYDRGAWFLRVIMSSSRALCCLPSVKKQKHDFKVCFVDGRAGHRKNSWRLGLTKHKKVDEGGKEAVCWLREREKNWENLWETKSWHKLWKHFMSKRERKNSFNVLYYYMRNFCNLIGLEQWYFSLIWNTYMWKLQTFCG